MSREFDYFKCIFFSDLIETVFPWMSTVISYGSDLMGHILQCLRDDALGCKLVNLILESGIFSLQFYTRRLQRAAAHGDGRLVRLYPITTKSLFEVVGNQLRNLCGNGFIRFAKWIDIFEVPNLLVLPVSETHNEDECLARLTLRGITY